MKSVISPRDFARAIGVSESSVKRWVDEGLIQASRTAGGHRRITSTEALRYVRESKAVLLKPEILGLEDLTDLHQDETTGDDSGEVFYEYLRTGAESRARGLLLSLYLDGKSVAQIIDKTLRPAMERIGSLWRHNKAGIFWEHRATDVVIQALTQLRFACSNLTAPVAAVGGAAPGDPYILPSLSACVVLESEGLPTVNLGPDTPLETLETSALDLGVQLVWLSVSSLARADKLATGVQGLAARLGKRGVPLILGGAKADRLHLTRDPYLYRAGSMAEFEALVRGLRLAASAVAGPPAASEAKIS